MNIHSAKNNQKLPLFDPPSHLRFYVSVKLVLNIRGNLIFLVSFAPKSAYVIYEWYLLYARDNDWRWLRVDRESTGTETNRFCSRFRPNKESSRPCNNEQKKK